MNESSPEGWEEVFSGACLEADMVQSLLESNGLKPVTRQLNPPELWSGSVFEDCRVYVPLSEGEAARRLLAVHHDTEDA